jgi:hypothetical protein
MDRLADSLSVSQSLEASFRKVFHWTAPLTIFSKIFLFLSLFKEEISFYQITFVSSFLFPVEKVFYFIKK